MAPCIAQESPLAWQCVMSLRDSGLLGNSDWFWWCFKSVTWSFGKYVSSFSRKPTPSWVLLKMNFWALLKGPRKVKQTRQTSCGVFCDDEDVQKVVFGFTASWRQEERIEVERPFALSIVNFSHVQEETVVSKQKNSGATIKTNRRYQGFNDFTFVSKHLCGFMQSTNVKHSSIQTHSNGKITCSVWLLLYAWFIGFIGLQSWYMDVSASSAFHMVALNWRFTNTGCHKFLISILLKTSTDPFAHFEVRNYKEILLPGVMAGAMHEKMFSMFQIL